MGWLDELVGIQERFLKNAYVFNQIRTVVRPLQGTPYICARFPGRRSKTSFPWAGMLRPFWAKDILMRH